MEVKKYIGKKAREQEGSVFFIFTIILIVVLTMSLIVIEYFQVITTHETVVTELERAGNIAVEYAMLDEARGYHISYIDEEEAKKEFDSFFKERLGLNNSFEKHVEGIRLYKVEFNQFKIDETIPSIYMEGRIIVDLQLVGQYMKYPVRLPFEVNVVNANTHD